MSRPVKHLYKFDDFSVDVTERVLLRDGEIVPLTQKAFDVLLALVERSGQIVEKDVLILKVWPDSFVEEGNLTQNIYTLRKVLGQTPEGGGYIVTIPRRGYRFAASVRELQKEEENQVDELAYAAPRGNDEGSTEIRGLFENAEKTESEIDDPAAAEFLDFSSNDRTIGSTVGSQTIPSREAPIHSPTSAGGQQGWVSQHKTAAMVSLIVLLIAAASVASFRFIGQSWLEAGTAREPPRKMTVNALTTTGNIACAAVSPDGNFVAYATADKPQLSSLWIEHPSTSTRRTIIPQAEVRYHALTFSPDGSYVYFVALTKDIPGRTLYRVSVLGGPTKKMLEKVETGISFSPDGRQFAFRRSLNERRLSMLIVAQVDGSGEREVTTVRFPETFYDPTWSPDGRVIACATGNPNGVASMSVVAVSTLDWTMKKVSNQQWQWVGQMAWLADSNNLVMVAADRSASPRQIWNLAYPSGEARRVTNDSNNYNRLSLASDSSVLAALQVKLVSNVWLVPAGNSSRARQITFGAGGYRGDLSWTPDGRIVYDSEAGSAATISVMDADGGNPKQLTGDLTGRAYVKGAVVSPNGRFVVFTSDQTGERHIWRMNIDGSNPIQLTHGNGEDDPSYSPDGLWVVYTELERSGADRPTLGRVSIDGGELVQLTDAFTAYPVVSPDGKLIACLNAEGPGDFPWRLGVFPFEGGRPIKVFPQIVQAQSVRWTPDGRGLTYVENPVAGASKIWIQPLDGGKPEQFAEFEADRVFGFDWSHDGKYLACVRGLWSTNVVLIKDFK